MKNNVDNLTLKEKLGQMIILGLDVKVVDSDILNLIREYKIGGVVLYKKSYDDVNSMIKLINKIKAISDIPLFVAVDQENGVVNRFPKDIKRIPGVWEQRLNNQVSECNEITIELMKRLGVNMNLAPVVDVCHNMQSSVNTSRCYSDNYLEVIKYGGITIKQHQEAGIIPVGKHFPGHGLARGDSHFVLPKIKDLKLLEAEDYQVFKRLIEDGLDVLMLGHLQVRGYGFKPVTMNKEFVMRYLNGYEGIIMTDDIQMNYLKYLYGLKRVFIKCLEAGNNIVMIKYQKRIDKVFDKILKIVDKDDNLLEKVDKSVVKILKIKDKYCFDNREIINDIDVDEINERILRLEEQ